MLFLRQHGRLIRTKKWRIDPEQHDFKIGADREVPSTPEREQRIQRHRERVMAELGASNG